MQAPIDPTATGQSPGPVTVPTQDFALQVRGLVKSFGAVHALRGVDFEAHARR